MFEVNCSKQMGQRKRTIFRQLFYWCNQDEEQERKGDNDHNKLTTTWVSDNGETASVLCILSFLTANASKLEIPQVVINQTY